MTVEFGFLTIILFIISLVVVDAAVPSFCSTADPIMGASTGKQGSSESNGNQEGVFLGVFCPIFKNWCFFVWVFF